MQTERMMRMKEVIPLIGVSRGTVYNMMKQGRFPRHQPISERIKGWPESVVRDWIRENRKTADSESE